MTDRLRVAAVLAVVAAVAVAATVVGVRRRPGADAGGGRPVATAVVIRTDLENVTQLTGALGFGDAVTVPVQGAPGTITRLPRTGALVRAGQSLFELDGAPVVLLRGARPAWRDLGTGVPPGSDVRQLEGDLVAMGYANRSTLTVDRTFTWATALAVRRWQRATHQPVTGRLALGRAVFLPATVRVAAAQQPLGTLVQPGQPVLTVTPTTPVVTLDVPVDQATLVGRGDTVTVTLPSGATRPGRVTSISPVTTEAASADAASQGPNSGPQQPQVSALVTLTRPPSGVDAALDQAPVTVSVVDQQVRHALAVPITALVALAGGGYGVWVDSPGPRHLVPVTPGLFASSLVEVHGSGLGAGDAVEVPSS